MRLPTAAPSARDQTDLLQLSRDALRRAGARPCHGVSPQALVGELGMLSDILGSVDGVLETIRAELWRRARDGRLASTDGPFAGEPIEALATLDVWAARARVSAATAQGDVDNAHVSVAGMAGRG